MKIDDLIGKVVVFELIDRYIYVGTVKKIEDSSQFASVIPGSKIKKLISSNMECKALITITGYIVYPNPIIFETEEDAQLYCEVNGL